MPRKKKSSPVDLSTTDRETVIFYKGRHPAIPGSHFYVVKDTNKEVSFSKKLHPRHKIGLGYFAKVTKEGRSFGVSNHIHIEDIEVWHSKEEITKWIRDDEAASKEAKRKSEEAGLRTKSRKLAQQIKNEYQRASHLTKRDIIASFVEELES